MLAGVEGTRQIGNLGQKFLGMADDVDAALYGKRALVVNGVAFFTVAVTAIEEWIHPRAPFGMTITTGLFSFLLFVLFVARLGALRDDDGNWSLGLVADRLRSAGTALREGLSAFGNASGPQRAAALGKCLVGLSLVGLALRNIVVLLVIIADELFDASIGTAQSLDETMMFAGMVTLALGAVCWLLGWWSIHSSPEAQRLQPNAAERDHLVAAARGLPILIDCTDKARALELAGRSGHPVLEALIKVLVTWQPRGAEKEADYQASLHRKLRRDLPGANPERERPIGDRASGIRGRADLVVSDSVLIEMKKGLTTTTAQRAVGQIQMYLRAWNRGPVMLLVCDTDPTTQPFLVKEMEELRRSRQAPVVMVFAGRR
ncbi:GxxExxY protein [Polyangium fumosum]|nr:GxxExxY protein [Polyangium fumosum]